MKVDLGNLKSGTLRGKSGIFTLPVTTSASDKCVIVVGSQGVGENPLPKEVNGIMINEDVSSLIFLQASALPSANQKSFFNVPNTFDSPDLLGWYEIIYEDGFKTIVPIQYGRNALEWNAAHKKVRETITSGSMSTQSVYCYDADAIDCSADPAQEPVSAFAFEWMNPRLGKIVKQVNLHGSINFQALLPEFEEPLTKPMESNAILLLAISKVKKRERNKQL